MKCPVCGTSYTVDRCPLCDYEDFFIVGMTEEERRRTIRQRVERLKEEFYRKIRVGIILYHYEVNEKGISESEERVLFPLVSPWDGTICWLPQKFENCSERVSVETDLYVEVSGKKREFLHHVTIRNIPGEGMREVGLRIDKNLQFCLNIRSDGEKTTESQMQYLFTE